ncbi:MAG: hypothetical protein U1E14_07330 [Geminicoccaceae bacterium]
MTALDCIEPLRHFGAIESRRLRAHGEGHDAQADPEDDMAHDALRDLAMAAAGIPRIVEGKGTEISGSFKPVA